MFKFLIYTILLLITFCSIIASENNEGRISENRIASMDASVLGANAANVVNWIKKLFPGRNTLDEDEVNILEDIVTSELKANKKWIQKLPKTKFINAAPKKIIKPLIGKVKEKAKENPSQFMIFESFSKKLSKLLNMKAFQKKKKMKKQKKKMKKRRSKMSKRRKKLNKKLKKQRLIKKLLKSITTDEEEDDYFVQREKKFEKKLNNLLEKIHKSSKKEKNKIMKSLTHAKRKKIKRKKKKPEKSKKSPKPKTTIKAQEPKTTLPVQPTTQSTKNFPPFAPKAATCVKIHGLFCGSAYCNGECFTKQSRVCDYLAKPVDKVDECCAEQTKCCALSGGNCNQCKDELLKCLSKKNICEPGNFKCQSTVFMVQAFYRSKDNCC